LTFGWDGEDAIEVDLEDYGAGGVAPIFTVMELGQSPHGAGE
jgi:hypothetical protein